MITRLCAALALTVGLLFPLAAQPQETEEVSKALKALLLQESELIQKKDAAAIAARFTSDGMLVMLAPKLTVRQGQQAIQQHYQSVLDAGATNITADIHTLEMQGRDMAVAAGTYVVTIKDKTVNGNWQQLLKREGGNWKIAVDTFARAALQ